MECCQSMASQSQGECKPRLLGAGSKRSRPLFCVMPTGRDKRELAMSRKLLRDSGLGPRPVAVLFSPFSRTKETAHIVCRAAGVPLDSAKVVLTSSEVPACLETHWQACTHPGSHSTIAIHSQQWSCAKDSLETASYRAMQTTMPYVRAYSALLLAPSG